MKGFKSAKDMLDILKAGIDLYNGKQYVYSYNDNNSIAVYDLAPDEAKRVSERAMRDKEYWSAMLGPGGKIYDDPSYQGYDPRLLSNLDYCEAHYTEPWEMTASWDIQYSLNAA